MASFPPRDAVMLAVGLELGYYTAIDADRWADAQIMATEQPDALLIELSLRAGAAVQGTTSGAHTYDTLRAAQALAGEVKPRRRFELAMGLLHVWHRDAPEQLGALVRKAFPFATEPGLVSSDEVGALYSLDDGYDLVASGQHGRLEDVHREFAAFTEGYFRRLTP